MTATNDARALQELLDKQALRELMMQYFRACDRRDMDLLRSCYHPEAIEDRGGIFKGGVEEWIAFVQSSLSQFEITVHRMFNADFRVNGDRAEGETYAEAYHRTPPPDRREIVGGGRYLDRFERRDGVWRVLQRVTTADRSEMRVADPAAYAHFVSNSMAGRPDAEDPLYRELTMFKRMGA